MAKVKVMERSKKVLTAEFPQALVVFSTTSYKPYILNESGRTIWDFCETPKDIKSVAGHLSKEYGISRTRAAKDIKKFLLVTRKNRLMRLYGRKNKI